MSTKPAAGQAEKAIAEFTYRLYSPLEPKLQEPTVAELVLDDLFPHMVRPGEIERALGQAFDIKTVKHVAYLLSRRKVLGLIKKRENARNKGSLVVLERLHRYQARALGKRARALARFDEILAGAQPADGGKRCQS